jgi:hypothetical protein
MVIILDLARKYPRAPSKYLTSILRFQASDISRSALYGDHHQVVQSTSNLRNLHAGIPNFDVGTLPILFFDLTTIHLPHHGTSTLDFGNPSPISTTSTKTI